VGRAPSGGESKPETFDFLGFTHCCAKRWSDGGFTVIRTSMAKLLGAAVKKIGQTLKAMRATTLDEQGKWLGAVERGWLATTPCPETSRPSTASAIVSSKRGGAPCADVARRPRVE